MLARIGDVARRWIADQDPWTNVYGVARTLLALGTLTTFAFTPAAHLFEMAAGANHTPVCEASAGIGVFCVVRHLELARWISMAAMVLVASGWRPRVTAPLHWWIAFSLQNNGIVLDGGDQVTLVLVTLMLPIALTDRRTWHWQAALEPKIGAGATTLDEARRLVAVFARWLIRIQVAGIYFHAAIGKFGVEEWVDGTAVYYFFGSPTFGATSPVLAVLHPLLNSPIGVCMISWGTLLLEYSLSAALFMPKRNWRYLLWAGLALHAGIIAVHGLVSFGLAMFAALTLYLRPLEATFSMEWLSRIGRALRPRGRALRISASVEA